MVCAADSYEAALELAAKADRALFFYENEHAHTLTAALTGEAVSPARSLGFANPFQ